MRFYLNRLASTLAECSQRYQNLKIGQKLNVSFGLFVGLAFIIIGVFSLNSLQARANIERVQMVDVPLALESAEAQTNLLKMLSNLRGYLATAESEFRNEYQAARQAFEVDLRDLGVLIQTGQQPGADTQAGPENENFSHLTSLYDLYEQWVALPEQMFTLRDNTIVNQPALALLRDQGEIPIAVVLNELNTMMALQIQRPTTVDNTQLFGTLSDLRGSFALMVAAMRSYLTTQSPSFRFEYGGQRRANQEAWDRFQRQRSQLTAVQQAKFDTIEQARSQFLQLPDQLFEIVEGDRYRQDLFIFRTEAEPLATEILQELEQIVDNTYQSLSQELSTSLTSLANAQVQTFLISLLFFMLAASLTVLLRRSITQPIRRLTQVAMRIGKGNLNLEASVESQDEVGTLAQVFNVMTRRLKQSLVTLEEYNQDLEQKVTSRTQELEAKNVQIQNTLADLQKTQAQLIQTEKMSSLGQLVAGVAHEINNPVNFIHGNLSPLADYTQDLIQFIDHISAAHPELAQTIETESEAIDLDFVRQDLPMILSSMNMGTKRIREIVLSLRNFSRLDEAEVKTIDLHDGLESTLLILQNRLRAKGDRDAITVTRHYGSLPQVECHAGQMNQVFMNILANSLDALDDAAEDAEWQATRDRPELTIRTSVKSDQTVMISIEDNALGIPDPIHQHIFEPFFTTKDVGKGTGMGLSISYQIVTETHQGTLSCHSKPGQGTQFLIQIPIQKNIQSTAQSPSQPTIQSTI
ncbi:MAG: ATP-binding protein [Leptolyngbyaceae cyanobacterium]